MLKSSSLRLTYLHMIAFVVQDTEKGAKFLRGADMEIRLSSMPPEVRIKRKG
jgi:hypothetical protein